MRTKNPSRAQVINALFKNAKRILKSQFFDILCTPNHEKLLVVVTSRKIGGAVQRNKIRRQIKSIFSQEHLLKEGLGCIVIVKKRAIGLSFNDIAELLIHTFHELESI